MDVQFELTPDDVDMVLRERGLQALKEPALYNIAILDRLLDSQPDLADIMIRSLVGLGDAQRQFLQAYLDAVRRHSVANGYALAFTWNGPAHVEIVRAG